MDAPHSNDEDEQQHARLAAEIEELMWANYWYQSQVNFNNRINNGGGLGEDEDDDNNSRFFGPEEQLPDRQTIWPWYQDEDEAPEAVCHQPGAQLQQQVAQQQVAQEQVAQEAAMQQPIHQQPIVQQPWPANLVCPELSCPYRKPRLDHLYDHLAENHGYDRAAKEYSVDPQHLKRKRIDVLQALFIRDTRKLAWNKARLLASEEAIRQADPSYASRHGLELSDGGHSITAANACRKKDPLRAKLIAVRNEMGRKGRLCNQGAGEARSSWGQVCDDLVATFHLARDAVDRRAERHFDRLRAAMGDDMAQNVTPAQVELTHELQLKPGASLPPK